MQHPEEIMWNSAIVESQKMEGLPVSLSLSLPLSLLQVIGMLPGGKDGEPPFVTCAPKVSACLSPCSSPLTSPAAEWIKVQTGIHFRLN